MGLIRLARHGTADNDDGHGDDATRLWRRVSGGFGGRPLGLAQDVRSCLDLAAWLAGVLVSDLLPGARVGGVRVSAIRVVAGRVGACGWMDG